MGPLVQSFISLACFIATLSLAGLAFGRTKAVWALFTVPITGIAGIVFAILALVQVFRLWNTPEGIAERGQLILSACISGIFVLALIVVLLFLLWIVIGYRNGL